MIRSLAIATAAILSICLSVSAQEYKVAKTDGAAPASEIAPEIAALLQPAGFKVSKGDRPIFEMWLTKEWPLAADAKTGGEVLYPLTPGQLIGAARYSRKGGDFRDQEIPAGTYVVRYAQQPIDGAHVGTSPTRDFLLLLPASKDREAKTMEYKTLTATSKETTGTAHPAILSMQKAEVGDALSVREEGDRGWVIVHFVGKAKEGNAAKDLPVDLVVVGKAAE